MQISLKGQVLKDFGEKKLFNTHRQVESKLFLPLNYIIDKNRKYLQHAASFHIL